MEKLTPKEQYQLEVNNMVDSIVRVGQVKIVKMYINQELKYWSDSKKYSLKNFNYNSTVNESWIDFWKGIKKQKFAELNKIQKQLEEVVK